MTQNEIHAKFETLSAEAFWTWLYKQTPEHQEMALQLFIALAGKRNGWHPNRYWEFALSIVPEGCPDRPWFHGINPSREWKDILAIINGPVGLMAVARFTGGEVTGLSMDDGIAVDAYNLALSDTAQTLCAGRCDINHIGGVLQFVELEN